MSIKKYILYLFIYDDDIFIIFFYNVNNNNCINPHTTTTVWIMTVYSEIVRVWRHKTVNLMNAWTGSSSLLVVHLPRCPKLLHESCKLWKKIVVIIHEDLWTLFVVISLFVLFDIPILILPYNYENYHFVNHLCAYQR